MKIPGRVMGYEGWEERGKGESASHRVFEQHRTKTRILIPRRPNPEPRYSTSEDRRDERRKEKKRRRVVSTRMANVLIFAFGAVFWRCPFLHAFALHCLDMPDLSLSNHVKLGVWCIRIYFYLYFEKDLEGYLEDRVDGFLNRLGGVLYYRIGKEEVYSRDGLVLSCGTGVRDGEGRGYSM
jgi:hypothetical protein